MLRDAKRCQVIQKFSFIESLSLSHPKNRHGQPHLGKLNTDQAFSFQQQRISNPGQLLATKTQKQTQKKIQQQPSAIITTSGKATTIDSNWYQPTSDFSLSLAEIIHATRDKTGNYPEPNFKSNFNPTHRSGYLAKILFALACSYSLFVIWWLFGHQGSNLLVTLMGGKNVVLSKSEIEFIDYLERSLDQIDRQKLTNPTTKDGVVYVPVYTPAPANSTIASNNLPLGTFPSSSPNSSVSSMPMLPVPNPEPSEPLAIPEPPPLPAPTPLVDNFTSAEQIEPTNQMAIAEPQQSSIATRPDISHTLVGVLELGAGRAAALVKIKGQTRRVWVGEAIDSNGWVLESISDQQANISNQGQVRAISVGETF
jgi:hypothetical protein